MGRTTSLDQRRGSTITDQDHQDQAAVQTPQEKVKAMINDKTIFMKTWRSCRECGYLFEPRSDQETHCERCAPTIGPDKSREAFEKMEHIVMTPLMEAPLYQRARTIPDNPPIGLPGTTHLHVNTHVALVRFITSLSPADQHRIAGLVAENVGYQLTQADHSIDSVGEWQPTHSYGSLYQVQVRHTNGMQEHRHRPMNTLRKDDFIWKAGLPPTTKL